MAFTPLPNLLGKAILSIFLLNSKPPYNLKCPTRLTFPHSTNNVMAFTCLSISQPPSKPGSRGTCSTPKKGIIGTPKVPLPASFFHCALAIESGQVVHHWIPTPNEPTLHPPRNRPPVGAPTAEATETYLNTYADIRMEQYLRSPPVIQTGIDISDSHPPRESDHDTEILNQSATEAFQRLIDAIDNPSPKNV